jgi:PDZ domain/Aspartyl protease
MRHTFSPIRRIAVHIVWASILLIPLPAAAPRAIPNKPRRKPIIPAPNYHFTSGTSALGIPFQVLSNFVLVQLRMNNSRPLCFLLSTASTSVIDTRIAKELGLPVHEDKSAATGSGIEGGLISGVSLALPGVTTFNQTVAVLPLEFFSSIMGQPIAGLIGYDFISQFVIEVDYAKRKMNVYAPATYRYSGTGDVLPIKFIDKSPFVAAKITMEGREAVEGTFEFATESSGVLVVQRSFAEAHQLLKSVKGFRLGHVGGSEESMSRTLQGRVKNIQVGRFMINNPLVSFSQAEADKDATDGDGQIGGEVLRRFRLILDYSRQRIILEPNQHLAEPVEQDMSGFELVAEGADLKTLTINEVLANSPAAEAGLQEEDELIAIDGRPVTELSLEQIRQMLKQEGKEYVLKLKRGSQALQVKLKTRRLI